MECILEDLLVQLTPEELCVKVCVCSERTQVYIPAMWHCAVDSVNVMSNGRPYSSVFVLLLLNQLYINHYILKKTKLIKQLLDPTGMTIANEISYISLMSLLENRKLLKSPVSQALFTPGINISLKWSNQNLSNLQLVRIGNASRVSTWGFEKLKLSGLR